MKHPLTLLFILSAYYCFAQIDAGSDITICEIVPVDLSATYTPNSVGTSDYTIETIPINCDPYEGTNIPALTDDSYSGVVDIGFNFCYYGNVYDQLIISTNNYLCFDITDANGYSPWNTVPIPSGGTVSNSILGPWMDLNPNNGGSLEYQVLGVAPFRRLVVSFENFGYFSCGTMVFNGQIKIFETTNSIEIHVEDMPSCTNWNNGESVLGIVNEDESQFVMAPGWNNTQLTGNDAAFRFVPSGITGTNVEWFDDLGVSQGTGVDVTVNPITTTTYTVVAQECPDNVTSQVTVNVSSAIAINPVIDDNVCPGENVGSIDISPSGGTNPLSIQWNSSNGFSSNNEDIFNLGEGDYNLTITDGIGCETFGGPYTISPPPLPIEVSQQVTPVSCFGFSDGQINISTSGGNAPYNYAWSGDGPVSGDGTNMVFDLSTGNYSVNITDDNGCLFNTSFYVPENSALSINTTESNYNGFNNRCYGNDDAWVSTSVTGGLLPYNYVWTDQNNNVVSNNPDLYDAKAGTYRLTVTDIENCPNVKDFDLTQPDSISLDVSNYSHKSCTYNNDGTLEIASWGGPDSPPFSENYNNIVYKWTGPNSFYSTQEDISNLSEGVYSVIAEDINNCTNEISFEITQNEEIVSEYRTIDDTVTINYPIINLFDNSQGMVMDWSWEISNGYFSNSQDILNLDLTTNLTDLGQVKYDVSLIVTDIYGCSDTTMGIISIKDEHTLYVPNAFTPDMDGWNDVFEVDFHAINDQSFKLDIFDRFGAVIFSTTDPEFKWDGKHQNTGNELITGAYTYNISYSDFEGRNYDFTNCKNCMGTVSIIR